MDDFKQHYRRTKATMSCCRTAGLPRERRVNILVNTGNGIDFGVHNSNVENLKRALLERVFFVSGKTGFQRPPQPRPLAFKVNLKRFKQQFRKHVGYTTAWSFDQFVNSYTGRKYTMYENAVSSFELKPLDIRDSYISAFVKAEKVNFSAKSDPAPRVIQPRSPRYNAAVGIYIKAIEHKIYNVIADVYGAPTVSKGLNAGEMGKLIAWKWDQFNDPVAIGLDASRFDQHCSVQALKWEHSIYRLFFPKDKHFAKLLRWQLNNKGFGNCPDGKIKYTTEGCRMSGDMNTGLGNCLLMCGMIYAYMQSKNCRYELINNGDDCVLFMERQDINKLDDCSDWFVDMGFTMKIEEPVYILEKVVFCQMSPIFDGIEWLMVRDPRTCLTKDLISIKPLGNVNSWKFFCQAVSDSGLACAGGIPIFNEFYQMLNVGGRKRKVVDLDCGLEFMADRMTRGYTKPTDEARLSFWRAFDIVPDTQLEIEGYFRTRIVFNPGPVVKFKLAPELINTNIYILESANS